jgi:hypothetical protein
LDSPQYRSQAATRFSKVQSQLPDLVLSLSLSLSLSSVKGVAGFGKDGERRLDVLHLFLGEFLEPQQAVGRLSVDPDEFVEPS